jgi:AbrB family looped-hinge helix DNA binding protein
MSKVTSKLQLTVPKVIADRYGIKPGDELQWTPSGESIRIELGRGRSQSVPKLTVAEKLEIFDKASQRLLRLQKQELKSATPERAGRGWKRDDLYTRGLPR